MQFPDPMMSTQLGARQDHLLAQYRRSQTQKVRSRVLFGLVLAAGVGVSAWVGEVDIPNLIHNAHRFTAYFGNTVPELRWSSLGADLAEWYWGLDRWLKLLGETLLIAYVGTLFGVIGAFLLCFLAAANIAPSRAMVFASRRALEFLRTVPELVFALLFVFAFGLGPLPGVLAIVMHTMGALGKLFAEVVENIDMGPVDGITGAGGNRLEVIRFAVLPQVFSNFASYSLLRFEVNVRSAAIMGFVGAGGIGHELLGAIRKFFYTDVSAIVILIMLTVMVIDLVTEQLRHRLLGWEFKR